MRSRTPGRLASVLLLATAVTAERPAPARAGDRLEVSVGTVAGVVLPDPDLADYRWDVSGRASWGIQGLAGRGRLRGGLRVWGWGGRQGTGILGDATAPRVRLLAVQATAQGRLGRLLGVGVAGMAGVGRVHLGYSPDRLQVAVPGAPGPVEVAFRPADEWIGSVGVVASRDLDRHLRVSAETERSFFSLETAHRLGDAVITGRRTFASWSLRLGLSWVLWR